MPGKKQVQEKEADGYQTGMRSDLTHSVSERFPTGCLQITLDTPPDQWPTSMVQGSKRHKAALVNCMCTPDLHVETEWSEPFIVRDWLTLVQERVDEKTGEINRFPWLALVCDDGSIVGTSSTVAPHQLANALRNYSEEEWKQGIAFKIRARKSRSTGFYYHELRVVE